MRTTKLAILAVVLGLLGGCDGAEHAIVSAHKVKAATMCKFDKGLKTVLDANGANFTAQCRSGIIVAGVAQL